jgi:hypothetical protein
MDGTTLAVLAFDAGILAGGFIAGTIAARTVKRLIEEKFGPAVDELMDKRERAIRQACDQVMRAAAAPRVPTTEANIEKAAADFARRYTEKQAAIESRRRDQQVRGELQQCNHAGVMSAAECPWCNAARRTN